MPPYTSLAKRASIITADEWATGKFDGRANAHPGPPLATPLPLSFKYPLITYRCTINALSSKAK